MLNYLLAILGLALLTSLWMVFQLWLKKHDPEREDRCVGCGTNCKRQGDKTHEGLESGTE